VPVYETTIRVTMLARISVEASSREEANRKIKEGDWEDERLLEKVDWPSGVALSSLEEVK
jgi:hypothetical protein